MMHKKYYTWICTLLGAAAGFLLCCYVSIQSENTINDWWHSLFVKPDWVYWSTVIVGLIIPTLTGFCIGLRGKKLSCILGAPIGALLAGFGSMILFGLALIVWENRVTYGGLALIFLIGALIPTTYTVVVALRK